MSEPEERIDEQDQDPTAAAAGQADGGSGTEGGDAELDALARAEAQLRRSMADLANLRKRMHREVDEARRRAIEGLTADLLPVLDNFHLALGVKDRQDHPSGSFDPDAVVEGMRMVESLLESVLERHGLSEIPAEGCTFDPNLHEAVGIDTISDAAAGQVTQVVQRGYRIADKVLRASRVLVRGEDPNREEGR